MAQRQRRVEVDLPAEGGDDLLAVVAVGEDAAGGDQAVDGVADGADQNPKKREAPSLRVYSTIFTTAKVASLFVHFIDLFIPNNSYCQPVSENDNGFWRDISTVALFQ